MQLLQFILHIMLKRILFYKEKSFKDMKIKSWNVPVLLSETFKFD